MTIKSRKFIKINKKILKGNYDLKIDIKNTIPYKEFFKKIGDKVYRYSKLGDEDWREDITPFIEVPYKEI